MDDYLYTNAKRWWQWGCKRKESRVCTRVVSTGSEGIQQWKFITIRRKRVRVWWSPMSGFSPIMGPVDGNGCPDALSFGTSWRPLELVVWMLQDVTSGLGAPQDWGHAHFGKLLWIDIWAPWTSSQKPEPFKPADCQREPALHLKACANMTFHCSMVLSGPLMGGLSEAELTRRVLHSSRGWSWYEGYIYHPTLVRICLQEARGWRQGVPESHHWTWAQNTQGWGVSVFGTHLVSVSLYYFFQCTALWPERGHHNYLALQNPEMSKGGIQSQGVFITSAGRSLTPCPTIDLSKGMLETTEQEATSQRWQMRDLA